MKVLALLVACCFAVILAEDRNAEFKQIALACRKEFGVNEEEFVNLKAGKLNPADVKENMKCSVKCFMVKAGLMNDAGQVNTVAVKAALAEKPGVDEAIEKCKSLDNANICEKAFQVAHCVFGHKVDM